MRVWLVFVNREVKHVCKSSHAATKRLGKLQQEGLDAWCMEFTVEEE